MCKQVSPQSRATARQWEFPICNAFAKWALFQISLRPQKEIEAKLGDGRTFHSGPSFARLRYHNMAYLHCPHFTQIFPGDLLEPTYADPNNPEQLIARSEIERRGRFLEQLEREQHYCTQLIKDCLHNLPSRRPTAEQLLATLEGMRADIEGPCGAVARADAVRQVVMMRTFMVTQSAMRERTNELAVKDETIQQLRLQIEVDDVYFKSN